jgi:hypothetical protein
MQNLTPGFVRKLREMAALLRGWDIREAVFDMRNGKVFLDGRDICFHCGSVMPEHPEEGGYYRDDTTNRKRSDC